MLMLALSAGTLLSTNRLLLPALVLKTGFLLATVIWRGTRLLNTVAGSGATTPLAISTAALASTMPTPIGTGGATDDGKLRAVLVSTWRTSAGDSAGCPAATAVLWISAATPATCGAAIDVPT